MYPVQVIAAEGEQKASKALREAAEVIAESPSALQLRYLQVRIGCVSWVRLEWFNYLGLNYYIPHCRR